MVLQYLTSPISGCTFWSSFKCFIMKFPTSKACSWRPSCSITSSTAWATSHETGLPPNYNKRFHFYNIFFRSVRFRNFAWLVLNQPYWSTLRQSRETSLRFLVLSQPMTPDGHWRSVCPLLQYQELHLKLS